ncbi:hypothetical protein N1031_17170 [Herbiconiux moechotypicola]|nr:hypothetical protein [Herbiconiux moechotypicola]
MCTGNICRSPLAEKLMRKRLADAGAVDPLVTSAGLHAVVGGAMDAIPAAIAERNGLDPTHHARQLGSDLARSGSMFLTLTRAQRDELTQEFPVAMRRTFTLVEIVRLMKEHPLQVTGLNEGRDLFDVSMDASRSRPLVTLGEQDDVIDPYRRSAATHEAVGQRIEMLVSELSGSLIGSGRTR